MLEGDQQIATVTLANGVYTIGAASQCEVRLPAVAGPEGVAPEHAAITVRGERVLFHHLADHYHSLVNGERTVWAVLEPGDVVTIGPYRCHLLPPAGGDPRGATGAAHPSG